MILLAHVLHFMYLTIWIHMTSTPALKDFLKQHINVFSFGKDRLKPPMPSSDNVQKMKL